MKSHKTAPQAIIPLGRATSETRGSWGPYSDDVIMQLTPGLSKD